jgi:hypothetical protein
MSDYGAFAFLVKEAEVSLDGPLPSLEEVMYAPPNPDGSRKSCGNCWKFVTTGSCVEVEGDISEDQVCGYHVFGTPFAAAPPSGADKMSQAVSGLITKRGGTSCDICKAYDPGDAKGGHCKGVQKGGKLAVVQARGCCGRWHDKGQA